MTLTGILCLRLRAAYGGANRSCSSDNKITKQKHSRVRLCFVLVKRIIANKNIVIFKVNNTELFCQVELPLSDYPLYGKQIAAS